MRGFKAKAFTTRADFKEAGYESPADWARLRDLLPSPGPGEDIFARKIENWRITGSSKSGLLKLLAASGIHPEPFDSDTVGRRNA
jgi:hypothetical protein